MATLDRFDDRTLRAICEALGDTQKGLTNSEIKEHLDSLGIDDPSPSVAKRRRLFQALKQRQERDRCGNQVGAFIKAAMDPVLYTSDRERYEWLREEVNIALSFAGLKVGEDGELHRVEKARSLTQAQRRAQTLKKKLENRGVHPDVLRFCDEELVQENYFHAVFEATKSVADKIREKADLDSDGAKLVRQAFDLGQSGIPVLAINKLETETEKSEQKGFANLLKGLFGTFRNTTAHAPKVKWEIDEQDALDLFTLASLCHRRIDDAVNVRDVAGMEVDAE
jgi:uncharacterized protein (TIGR02391 family)